MDTGGFVLRVRTRSEKLKSTWINGPYMNRNELEKRDGPRGDAAISNDTDGDPLAPCPDTPTGEHNVFRCYPRCCDTWHCMHCNALFALATDAELRDELIQDEGVTDEAEILRLIARARWKRKR
jgi:hypothetical protein